MAVEIFQRFPKYFPWQAPASLPVQVEGPRRGMPAAARQVI